MNSIKSRKSNISSILRYFTFIILFIYFSESYAQLLPLSYNGNPSSMKWKYIENNEVKVIYPLGLRLNAERVANVVTHLQERQNESIGSRRKKVDILLQNQTSISNGFVSIAPFRSEFFTTAPQNGQQLAGDWMDLLAIHEHRHLLQFLNAKESWAFALGGETAWGASAFLALPIWYWEGDATVTETALTRQGRGRLPDFSKGLRAVLLNNKNFSYEKVRNGSYKDIVPSHYPYGYYLSMYGRKEFGNDLWKKVSFDATKYRGIIYPFSNSLKNNTGMRSPKFYKATIEDLTDYWSKEERERKLISSNRVTKKARKVTPTSYRFARYMTDSTLLAVKASYDKIPALYLIDSKGNEQRLIDMGLSLEPYITNSKNKVVWSELAFSPRWTEKDYSIIVSYDLKTNKKKYLTKQTKYFSPSISPSDSKIAVAEVSPSMINRILILDAENGSLLDSLPNEENNFFSYPVWSKDESKIYAVCKKGNKRSIIEYDIEAKSHQLLFDYIENTIDHLFVKENKIYFSSNFSKVENIYAFDLTNKNFAQVSSVQFGAYSPSVSPSGNKIVYTNYDFDEEFLQEQNFTTDSLPKIVITPPAEQDYYYIDQIAKAEGGVITNNIKEEGFEEKEYSWSEGFIKPHSWVPVLSNTQLGASIYSTNLLKTLNADLGYRFNTNDKSHHVVGKILYSRYYPIFTFGSEYIVDQGRFSNFLWNETNISAGVLLPFNLTRSKYLSSFTPSVSYRHHFVKYTGDISETRYDDFNFGDLNTGYRFYYLQRIARKHINSRLGFQSNLNYQKPFNNTISKGQFYTSNTLFLPGVFANHSLYVNGSYQRERFQLNYLYTNLFFDARGYSVQNIFDEKYKFSLNYSLPILYPEVAIPGIIYNKRIFLNVFYDHGIKDLNSSTSYLRSVGAELNFEFNLFRLGGIITGIRYSKLLDEDTEVVGKDKGGNQLGFFFGTILTRK